MEYRYVVVELTDGGSWLQQTRCFDMLLNEMRHTNMEELVGRLAMSPDTPIRRLGVFLFDKLDIKALSGESLETHGGLGLKVLFYEVQRTVLSAESLARLYVSMMRHVSRAGEDFKNELVDELKLQACNLARGCRQELERRGGDLPEIVEALKSVDDYFKGLKIANEAGINAMDVPGHRHAAMLYGRRFSQQVTEGAKRYSPVVDMTTEVKLLYGETVSIFISGRLQDAMPLVSNASSIEIPIVEFWDPEGMASRRIHASAAIQRLLENERHDGGER